MFKKLISLMMSVMILCGLVSSTVNADAPLYFDGITTNVFDVDFGDIDSAIDAPEFTFSGSWDYTGEFVALPGTKNGYVKTKNNIDLTDAYGYEFSTETIITQNAMIIYLAYDTTNLSGYRVVISRKNSNLTVYKADGSVLRADGSETDSVAVSTSYGVATEWIAKLEDKTLTISKGSTEVFKGTDTQASVMNGKFGVESSAIENFAVLNMKLDKLGNVTTVNDWHYEKTISAKDTKESLATEGITFTTKNTVTPTYSADNGINFNSNPSTTHIYYDKKLSGDYTVITSYYTYNGNATRVLFNGSSIDNSYSIVYDIKSTPKTYSIRKYTEGTGTILPVAPGSTELASAELSKSSTTVSHVLNFKDNGDDTITVTATAYRAKTISSTYKTAEVSAIIKKSELYTSDYNKIRVYWSAPGKSKFYRLTAYSTPSNETVARDVDLLNKKFVTGDTATSLKKEGITVTAPTSIKTIDGGLNTYGNTKDGLYWNNSNSSGSTYHAYVTYDKTVSGDYTFEAKTKAQQNETTFQINRQDSDNQYEVAVSARTNDITIKKIENGATPEGQSKSESLTNSKGEVITSGLYGYGYTTTIDVKNNEDGTLTITADVYAKSGDIIGHCEYTDTTGTPFTSGICRIHFDKNQGSYRMLYEMKITQHGTYTEDGAYTGKFYIDGEEATSYKKGEIYFETPVVDLGTYTVVAALYEDNEMTDIKTFTPREIYEGKVKLFDTTDSTAATGEVKVFFLDSGDTLNKTMDVWSLR